MAFLGIALVAPTVLKPLNRLWFAFGLLLQRIVNPLITGILFYGMFVPMGLVMRLFRKDPLHLEFQPDEPTYWIRRTPPGPPPAQMKNQF